VGRLLLLRDVTEQKRVQAQILEQQKVQAVLEERAGLAREMHDSIDQSLAAAQLQRRLQMSLSTAGKSRRCMMLCLGWSRSRSLRMSISGNICLEPRRSRRGKMCLSRSTSTSSSSGRDFGPPTELVVTPEMKEQGLDSQAGCNNTHRAGGAGEFRKHAHANAAQVVFAFNAGRIQVRIEDDGVGFDVARFSRPRAKGSGFDRCAIGPRRSGHIPNSFGAGAWDSSHRRGPLRERKRRSVVDRAWQSTQGCQ